MLGKRYLGLIRLNEAKLGDLAPVINDTELHVPVEKAMQTAQRHNDRLDDDVASPAGVLEIDLDLCRRVGEEPYQYADRMLVYFAAEVARLKPLQQPVDGREHHTISKTTFADEPELLRAVIQALWPIVSGAAEWSQDPWAAGATRTLVDVIAGRRPIQGESHEEDQEAFTGPRGHQDARRIADGSRPRWRQHHRIGLSDHHVHLHAAKHVRRLHDAGLVRPLPVEHR